MSTCDFNRMYDYMKADPRFSDLSHHRRKVIVAWAQREYKNLLIAHQAGVRCPVPHAVKDHVLVMDLIGSDGQPAQQLSIEQPADPQAFFDETVAMMRKLHKAKLVHADLSQYNILNDDQKPVFIDMSQGTTYGNPNWKRFLQRDCRNIANYFKKLGIKTDEQTVWHEITGE
jgi:RIO kinase 1